MKKDRRHQLAQNSLAKWLEKNIEAIKPHSSLISRVVIGLLLVVLVFTVWQHFNRGNQAGFSQDLATAILFGVDDPSQLAPMLSKYPTGVEHAQFQILFAEVSLRQAEFQLTTKREEAKENLKNAQESFQTALKWLKSPEFQDRCHWGLARTHEVLAAVQEGNDLEEAQKLYEQLAGNEKSVYYQLAKDRQEILNRSWVPVFLASSQKFQPKDDLLPDFDPTIQPPETSESGALFNELKNLGLENLGIGNDSDDKATENSTENLVMPELELPNHVTDAPPVVSEPEQKTSE